MATDPTPILELRQVSKYYGDPADPLAVKVLQNLDLKVFAGESLAVMGPSGCGKSTMLNLIGSLDTLTSGKILFEGQDRTLSSDEDLAHWRNQKVGFIFQSHHLLPQCTVWENVLIPTLASKSSSPSNTSLNERAKRLLEKVQLGHRIHHFPSQLSGGERQRAAVVRALINQPALLLADEPTGALDRISAENLATLLVQLNKEEGVTLIVVTHSEELARQMQRHLELKDGQLTVQNP